MKRRIVLGLAGFFALLVGGAWYFIQSDLFAEWVKGKLVEILRREMALDVSINRLSLDVLLGRAVATGLSARVVGATPRAGESSVTPFVSVRQALVEVSVRALLDRRVVIERVVLDGAHVDTEIADGRLMGWPEFRAPKLATTGDAWRFEIRGVDILDSEVTGRLKSSQLPGPVSWSAERVSGRYRPSGAQGGARFEVASADGRLEAFGETERIALLSAEVALVDSDLTVESFLVRSSRVSFAARGTIPLDSARLVRESKVAASAVLPSEIAQPILKVLNPQVADSLRFGGRVALSGRYAPVDGKPAVDGQVDITGFRYKDIDLGNIAVRAQYVDNRVVFSDATIAVGGAQVVADGSLVLKGDFPLHVAVARIRGLSIPDLARRVGANTQGWNFTIVGGSVRDFRGSLAAANPRFHGRVAVNVSDLIVHGGLHGGRPVFHQRPAVVTGGITIDGRGVEIRGARVAMAGTTLDVNGRVGFGRHIEFSVEGDRFAFDDFPSMGRIRFFGRGSVRARLDGVAPETLFVSGFARVRGMRVAPFRGPDVAVGDVSGPILFGRGVFSFPHFRVEADGVRATLSGQIDLRHHPVAVDLWSHIDELKIENIFPRASDDVLASIATRFGKMRGDHLFEAVIRDWVGRSFGHDEDARLLVESIIGFPRDNEESFVDALGTALYRAAPDRLIGRLRGSVTGELRLRGPLDHQRLTGSANIQFKPLIIMGERMEAALVRFDFTGTEVNLREAVVWRGESLGQLRLKGRLAPDGKFRIDGETSDLTLADFENRRLKAANMVSRILFAFYLEGRLIRAAGAPVFDVFRVDGLRGNGHLTLKDTLLGRRHLGTSVVSLRLFESQLSAVGSLFFEPGGGGATDARAGFFPGVTAAAEDDAVRVRATLSLRDDVRFRADFDLAGRGKRGRNWAPLVLSSGAEGVSLVAKGRGFVEGELLRPETVRAVGTLETVSLSTAPVTTISRPGVEIRNRAPVAVAYSDGRLRACRYSAREPADRTCETEYDLDDPRRRERRVEFRGGLIDPITGDEFPLITLDVEAVATPDKGLSARAVGDVDMRVLGALAPEIDNTTGRVLFDANVTGPWADLRLAGTGSVKNLSIPFRSFPHGLESLTGRFALKSTVVRLRDVKGRFAGGRLSQLEPCEIRLGALPRVEVDCRVAVANAKVRFPADLPSTVSGEVSYWTDTQNHKLNGKLKVLEAKYAAPDLKKMSQSEGGGRSQPVAVAGKENLQFEFQLSAPGNLRVGGPGKWLNAEFRIPNVLTIKGTNRKFGLSGELTLVEGRATVENNDFIIKRAEVKFDEASGLNPDIAVFADTKLRDQFVTYDVSLEIRCRFARLKNRDCYSMYSTPSLPFEDIASLMLFGAKVSDINTAKSTTAGLGINIFQGILQTGGIKKYLPVDRFQIVPTYSEATRGTVNYVEVEKSIVEGVVISARSNITEPGKDFKLQGEARFPRSVSITLGYDSKPRHKVTNDDFISNLGVDLKFRHEF